MFDLEAFKSAIDELVSNLEPGAGIIVNISIKPARSSEPRVRAYVGETKQTLEERIERLCRDNESMTLGVLYNRLRGNRRAAIDAAISALIRDRIIKRMYVKHAKTGKPYERFSFVNR